MSKTLPPLPKPDTHCFDDDTGKDVWSHSPEQMQAYALAAIDAQGVPEICEPSCTTYELAAMVMSDCGHSTNNDRLLDRIANRISKHVDALLAAAQPAPQAKPQPLSDPLHNDIQSVLFEVEQAIQNGCCPWQIDAAFEAYEAARRLQQPAHGIKE